MRRIIALVGTILFLGINFCFAEEEITITTYYPSPYGSYNELTTYSNTYLATSSGNVGIGTTDTLALLTVRKDSPSPTINWGTLTVWDGRTTDYETGYGPGIKFQCSDNSSPGAPHWTDQRWAGIAAVTTAAWAKRPALVFYTSNAEYGYYDPPSEKMRISPTGNVGIGTPEPTSKLTVEDGHIYISTPGKGLILTSPDGTCKKIKVDNLGNLSTTYVDCNTGQATIPGDYCSTQADCASIGLVCAKRYLDNDGDGYGSSDYAYICSSSTGAPSGYSVNNDDCCDANANAKPGQTTYFTTNRGDGSFDYDCDGQSTIQPGSEYYCLGPCITTLYTDSGCTTKGNWFCVSRTAASCGGYGSYWSYGAPVATYDMPEDDPCTFYANYPPCDAGAHYVACR